MASLQVQVSFIVARTSAFGTTASALGVLRGRRRLGRPYLGHYILEWLRFAGRVGRGVNLNQFNVLVDPWKLTMRCFDRGTKSVSQMTSNLKTRFEDALTIEI